MTSCVWAVVPVRGVSCNMDTRCLNSFKYSLHLVCNSLICQWAWQLQNGPSNFSAIYFCPTLCSAMMSFADNGDGPLLVAALWSQALDSACWLKTNSINFHVMNTIIRRIHCLELPIEMPMRLYACWPLVAALQQRSYHPDLGLSIFFWFVDFKHIQCSNKTCLRFSMFEWIDG